MLLSAFLKIALTFFLLSTPVGPAGDGAESSAPEPAYPLVWEAAAGRGPSKVIEGDLAVEIAAKSAAVIDVQSGQVLYEKNARQKMPIASLTKLMSAYVFLQTNPDGRETVTIAREDDAPPSKIPFREGEAFAVKDLFFSGLIGSANNAVKAFARSTGLAGADYVSLMNKTAAEWKLKDTQFVEPTGLDPLDQSTAYDTAMMARRIFQNPAVRKATMTGEYSFRSVNSPSVYAVETTDKLLLDETEDFRIVAGKTGFLDEAGYCLAVQARNSRGGEIIAVILGAESDEARFGEMKELINGVFASYAWE